MSHNGIPTLEQARRARDQVLSQATAAGKRPSVLAVARRLGMTNTTFRRHFPDIAQEVSQARTRGASTPTSSNTSEYTRLRARNARLRRDNRQLREHLDLAIANIQRLALTAHSLQTELEAVRKITNIGTKQRNPTMSNDRACGR